MLGLGVGRAKAVVLALRDGLGVLLLANLKEPQRW